MRITTTQGFTLMELLIVVAIIGILAAVLIPNLLGARQRAYDTAAQTCANDIQTKQEMYQVDERTYATKAAMINEFTPTCTAAVEWSIDAATPYAFTSTVAHVSGKKIFTVTPSSLTSVNRP